MSTPANKIMNKSAKNTILDADVILFVVDRLDWDTRDDYVVEHLRNIPRPIICVVNKLDLIKDKNLLLPHMRKIKQMFEKVLIVPVSALKNQYLVELENEIVECLPQQSHFFPPNQITDKSERFFCAEIVREKVIRQLGNELPYQTSVDIDRFEVKENITFTTDLVSGIKIKDNQFFSETLVTHKSSGLKKRIKLKQKI